MGSDVARESGLDKGWKTMIPGVKNHPMMVRVQHPGFPARCSSTDQPPQVELRMQETIWEKIPLPLRENASRIKAAEVPPSP
jgi:hypothetical protein